MVPFIHDISFDLKEHVPNKNLTCKEALKKLQYVGAKVLYASNEQDRPLIKKVQKLSINRNHEGLEKFCSYLKMEGSSEYDVSMSDEENGLFFNSLDQGFVPSTMKKNHCKCIKTVDDFFYK